MRKLGLGAAALMLGRSSGPAEAARTARLNVLLFTADDLHRDSLGCFGGKVRDLTPNLDRFAEEGMRFKRAHVTVAICQPSRGVLATGLYGHNSGIMGFMHTDRDVPTIMETLGQAGYLTGVLGKVNHSTPKTAYKWDFAHDYKELGCGRSPRKYYSYCKEFFARCRDEGKPFYFMVNSHDPHRPFQAPGGLLPGAEMPSKLYKPEDVPVPGFLPDLPGVRSELSTYLNSVRRCDDTFGRVMQALTESGLAESTLVMFLSDNGIAVPFAKCNCYLASTRTPWIVRWPGVVGTGAVDDEHFVSGIDFFPTVLVAAGLPVPAKLDGRSFVPLLRGRKQPGRERVFTQIDRKAGGANVPMRCVQDAEYGYIFNAWSDGLYQYHNNNEGRCWAAMKQAAATDPAVAQRVKMFRLRAGEEFYDLRKDPDCLQNLVDDPAHSEPLERFRSLLAEWMAKTGDPIREAFERRGDESWMKGFREKLNPPRNRRKPRDGKQAKGGKRRQTT